MLGISKPLDKTGSKKRARSILPLHSNKLETRPERAKGRILQKGASFFGRIGNRLIDNFREVALPGPYAINGRIPTMTALRYLMVTYILL
jgi:hypothetical protein